MTLPLMRSFRADFFGGPTTYDWEFPGSPANPTYNPIKVMRVHGDADSCFAINGIQYGTKWMSTWMPVKTGEPGKRKVNFGGQQWLINALSCTLSGSPYLNTATYFLRIIKNPRPITTGDPYPGCMYSDARSFGASMGKITGWPNTQIIDPRQDGLYDYAVAGDKYGMVLFSSHPSMYIEMNPLHSWWSGEALLVDDGEAE